MRDHFGMERTAILIDICPSGLEWKKVVLILSARKQFRGFGGSGSVGTIYGGAQRAQVGGNTAREPADISVAESFVAREACHLGG